MTSQVLKLAKTILSQKMISNLEDLAQEGKGLKAADLVLEVAIISDLEVDLAQVAISIQGVALDLDQVATSIQEVALAPGQVEILTPVQEADLVNEVNLAINPRRWQRRKFPR